MLGKNDSPIESDDDDIPDSHDASIEGNNNKAAKMTSNSPTFKSSSNQNKEESSSSPSESSPSGAKAIIKQILFAPLAWGIRGLLHFFLKRTLCNKYFCSTRHPHLGISRAHRSGENIVKLMIYHEPRNKQKAFKF